MGSVNLLSEHLAFAPAGQLCLAFSAMTWAISAAKNLAPPQPDDHVSMPALHLDLRVKIPAGAPISFALRAQEPDAIELDFATGRSGGVVWAKPLQVWAQGLGWPLFLSFR